MLIENFDTADDHRATDSSSNSSADIHAGASVSEEDIAAYKAKREAQRKMWKKKNNISDDFFANSHEFSCREWKRACYLEEILLKNGQGQASKGNCRLSDTDSQSSFLTMDVTRLTRFGRCHTFFSSLAEENGTSHWVSAMVQIQQTHYSSN